MGENGGVRLSRAFWTTSEGGLARVEMMTPGALDGSPGRLDQIAKEI